MAPGEHGSPSVLGSSTATASSIPTGTEENPTYVIMQNQKGKILEGTQRYCKLGYSCQVLTWETVLHVCFPEYLMAQQHFRIMHVHVHV